MILELLFFISVALLIRLVYLEGRMHSSVKKYEPEIWAKIGSPSWLVLRWAFYGFRDSAIFKQVTDQRVIDFVEKSHTNKRYFYVCFGAWLVLAIIWNYLP